MQVNRTTGIQMMPLVLHKTFTPFVYSAPTETNTNTKTDKHQIYTSHFSLASADSFAAFIRDKWAHYLDAPHEVDNDAHHHEATRWLAGQARQSGSRSVVKGPGWGPICSWLGCPFHGPLSYERIRTHGKWKRNWRPSPIIGPNPHGGKLELVAELLVSQAREWVTRRTQATGMGTDNPAGFSLAHRHHTKFDCISYYPLSVSVSISLPGNRPIVCVCGLHPSLWVAVSTKRWANHYQCHFVLLSLVYLWVGETEFSGGSFLFS